MSTRKVQTRARFKGQTMPIIGLLLATGVLIGFLALAVDGGSALLQRRTMQNGADAGALAAVKLMGQNTLMSCSPTPCYPSYTLTTQRVYSEVLALASNNRGGTTGATSANYGVTMAWHYISGSPVYSGTYGPTLNLPSQDASLVPNYVDGVVVTTTVANPTTFVKAMPRQIVGNQLTSLTITAAAAGRVYPTCPPPPQPGRTMPFTRFYPSIQYELNQYGNDPLHPFPLWSSSSDIQNDGQFKNMLSLSRASFVSGQQLITQFDLRDAFTGPFSPNEDGTMCHYDNNQPGCAGQPTHFTDCTGVYPGGCAQMYGSPLGNNDPTDLDDWIFWRWRGLVSTTSTWGSMPGRQGDWAETFHVGDTGNNVHEPLVDLFEQVPSTSPGGPAPGPLSGPPLNLGTAITMTIFLWGQPWNNIPNNYADDGTYAQFRNDCPGRPLCGPARWDDLNITGGVQGGGLSFRIDDPNAQGNSIQLDRVRFTKYYTMVFYKTIVEGNASEVDGFILSPNQPGPNPGGCSWGPGNAVYSGQVSFP